MTPQPGKHVEVWHALICGLFVSSYSVTVCNVHGFPHWPASPCSCYDYAMWNTTTETHISLTCLSASAVHKEQPRLWAQGRDLYSQLEDIMHTRPLVREGKITASRERMLVIMRLWISQSIALSLHGVRVAHIFLYVSQVLLLPLWLPDHPSRWRSPPGDKLALLFHTFELRRCIFPSPLQSMWSEVLGD